MKSPSRLTLARATRLNPTRELNMTVLNGETKGASGKSPVGIACSNRLDEAALGGSEELIVEPVGERLLEVFAGRVGLVQMEQGNGQVQPVAGILFLRPAQPFENLAGPGVLA